VLKVRPMLGLTVHHHCLLWAPFLPSKWMTTLMYAQLFAVYAMGWDILSGMTGQISFGHIFFRGGLRLHDRVTQSLSQMAHLGQQMPT
jgi:ABC-type branched-subunit amino acid transport system permease subunit